MNIYQGETRRQVGGGIWSTLKRGIRPLFTSVISKLKPHALDAGKAIATSALGVGKSMAQDVLSGRFNKANVKANIQNEVSKLKSKAIQNMKRRLDDEVDQTGSGHKRRRVQPKRKSKKMVKRKIIRRRKAPKRKSGKKRKTYKRKKANPHRKTRKGKVTKRKGHKRRVISKKAIRDIFG